MPQIIIDGQIYEAIYVEHDENGRCGIVTDKQTFWLNPVCGFNGEVEEWPKMPPVEITALSLDETNAPKSFIRCLQTEWQKFRQQWMASTTKERSHQVGMYMGQDKYGSWIRPNHKTPDLRWQNFKQSWFEGRREMVQMGMMARGLRGSQVRCELAKICYLATYPDEAKTKIFLMAVESSPHSREEAQEVRARMKVPESNLQISNTGTPAEAEAAAGLLCRISYVGSKRWKITFGACDPFFATDNGMGRELAYVLKHPHTEFHVLDVQHALIPTAQIEQKPEAALDEGLSLQSGTQKIRPGSLNPKVYANAKEQLDEKLHAARANGDTMRTQEIEDQIVQLERYQAEARHPVKDWAKRCNDRFRTGLKRFEAAVARDRTQGGNAFLEHLGKHLTLARFKFHYHPPHGFKWAD
jgi:hypothetical protein